MTVSRKRVNIIRKYETQAPGNQMAGGPMGQMNQMRPPGQGGHIGGGK